MTERDLSQSATLQGAEGSPVRVSEAVEPKRPPGPPPGPTNLVASRRNPLKFLLKASSFGDLTYFRLGPAEVYVAVHPDLIQDVLVTNNRKFHNLGTFPFLGNGLLVSEGEYHRQQRRIVKPAFHHTVIPRYVDAMVETTQRMCSEWRDAQDLDIHAEMNKVTLSIVYNILFGADIEHEASDLRESVATVMEMNGQANGAFGPVTREAAFGNESFKAAFARVNEFVYDMIARRRGDPDADTDVLSMLMEAEDEELGPVELTDEQIRDEILALTVAGHETTANALSWTWYVLSQHPELEGKLHAEVDEVLAGRSITFADLPSLTYTEKVFSEALRLYPPVPVSGRRVMHEYELDGYTIPVGARILLPECIVHRDPRWWPDPERFDPDRWTPEPQASRPKFAYFPFGGGPRLCIGEPFAWMEGKIILASIAQRWQVRPDPNHPVVLLPRISLRPAHGMQVRLTARPSARPPAPPRDHVGAQSDQRAPRPAAVRQGNPVEVIAARRNPLRFLERIANDGDLVRFSLGPQEMDLAVHPAYVKDVLVTSSKRFENLGTMSPFLGRGLLTSQGEFHRRQRRLIQPAFHHTRISGYGEIMVGYAERAQARWTDGQDVDVHREMADLTLDIVGKTLFDVELESVEASAFREALIRMLEQSTSSASPLAAPTKREPRPDLQLAAATINTFLYDLIAERRQRSEPGQDVLSMLLLAQDEEGDGKGMTDQQLRDEVITLVAAGHETVANALTWTWHLLAQNPEVEGKLHAELDEVLDGRLPKVDDLPSLTYTEMVLSEAMRLHPPVPMGGRQALADHQLGGNQVRAGGKVLFSQHVNHRDERWWPDPERFDPDRWLPEAKVGRPKFAYFPFGGGHRLCIGESFAWMEAELVVSTIASAWRMKLPEDHRMARHTGITLRPASGLRMQLESRRRSQQ